MGYHFREQESYVRILELTPELRKEIETTVEKLIAFLDRWDGDENLEETGDEQDTGMPEGWRLSAYTSAHVLEDDEDGNDVEQDSSDMEPDLGWTNHIDQTVARIIHAGGPFNNGETDLGWTGNATGWRKGEPLEEVDDEREPNGDEADYSCHD